MAYPPSNQQPAAICALKSPADAIHILEAVRLGMVPRVTRRLAQTEKELIRPGTVWVWEEEETNMKRWTDGRSWGASRVGGGGFLVYTETNESRSDDFAGPSRRFEGLIKQTYSTSMTQPNGKVKKFHVVAYSSKRNLEAEPLLLPSQLPDLANIIIPPGIWPDWEARRDDRRAVRPTTATASPSYPPPPVSPTHRRESPPRHPVYYERYPEQYPYRYPPPTARPGPEYPPHAYPPATRDYRRSPPDGQGLPFLPYNHARPAIHLPRPDTLQTPGPEVQPLTPVSSSSSNPRQSLHVETTDGERLSPRLPASGSLFKADTNGVTLPPLRMAVDERRLEYKAKGDSLSPVDDRTVNIRTESHAGRTVV